MKRYAMYKTIMKNWTDKNLSLTAKGTLSIILFDKQTFKDTLL